MKRVGNFQHHELPREGYEVFYRDSDHSYFLEVTEKGTGKGRLVSPSTFSKHAESDAGPLMGWAANKNIEGFCDLISEVLTHEEMAA